MKIPSNFGAGALPIRGYSIHNLPIVLRECQANAYSYDASLAHAQRIIFGEDHYLAYMHNGRSFANLRNITEQGLTPNESGGVGWSFQGSGLSYCASYLNGSTPKLVIASRTPEGFAAASATTRYLNNDWIIEEEGETRYWEVELRRTLGAQLFNRYNVFYLFRIPSIAAPLNSSYMATLAWLAPSMLNKPVLTYGENVLDIADGETLQSRHTRSSSWRRKAVPLDDFNIRYREAEWEFPTGQFQVNIKGEIVEMEGVVHVEAYPGKYAVVKDDKTNQWLANVRSGVSSNGRPFEEGRGSGMGHKPTYTAFMYAPVLANGHPSYHRFTDNAVYLTYHAADFLASLGLRYKVIDKGDPKPFAVYSFRLTALHNYTNSETQITKPIEPSYFAQTVGRRPDFLCDRDACHEILKAAAKAAAPNVPAATKAYFNEKFPADEHSRVPIRLTEEHKVNTNDAFTTYDVRTGEKFNGRFHAGESYTLAVWSTVQKKFLNEVTPSNSLRGVDIQAVANPRQTISMADGVLKQGYKALKTLKKIPDNQEIPFFAIDISPLEYHDGTSWQPVDRSEYIPYHESYRPSKGVHATALSQQFRVGSVEEVPAKPGSGANAHRGGGDKKGSGVGKEGGSPYDERDSRILVTYKEVGTERVVLLNTNHARLGPYYNVPDEVDSPSTRLLTDLYKQMRGHAINFARVIAPLTCNAEHVYNRVVDEEGKPIYTGSLDYIINQWMDTFIAEDVGVQNILEQVDRIRQTRNRVA